MIITKKSMFTQVENSMEIPISKEEYAYFVKTPKNERPNIQNLFPHLSNDEREFLLTGVTPEEWTQAFPEEEEYE